MPGSHLEKLAFSRFLSCFTGSWIILAVCEDAGWFSRASNLSFVFGFSLWHRRGEVGAQTCRVKGMRKRTFLCLEDWSWAFKQETWKIVDNPPKWPSALEKTLSVSLVQFTLYTGKCNGVS